ncbi:MAG TPA: PDZ domain-containing protein [Pirellulales bacterium]|nr:PDZ domain-containing protein [Pirellulales bacterium]
MSRNSWCPAVLLATFFYFVRNEGALGDEPEPAGFLGTILRDTNDGNGDGVAVASIVENSPAESAGLQIDDQIIEFDKQQITHSADLINAVKSHKPGARAELRFRRAGEEQSAFVVLTARPKDAELATLQRTIQASLKIGAYLDDAWHHRPGGRAQKANGARVAAIVVDSPASKAGLRVDDRILGIDGSPIVDASDAWRAITSFGAGKEIALDVLRNGESKVVVTVVGKSPPPWELLVEADPPRVWGGILSGNGRVIGDVSNPGNMICSGRFTIDGFFEQGSGDLLSVEISGPNPDAGLFVTGDVRLDGIVHVSIKDLAPQSGDAFELVRDAASLKGHFRRVMLPEPAKGLRWEIVYDDLTNGRDFDGDGKHDLTLVVEEATE